jgi:hypothetical protein
MIHKYASISQRLANVARSQHNLVNLLCKPHTSSGLAMERWWLAREIQVSPPFPFPVDQGMEFTITAKPSPELSWNKLHAFRDAQVRMLSVHYSNNRAWVFPGLHVFKGRAIHLFVTVGAHIPAALIDADFMAEHALCLRV